METQQQERSLKLTKSTLNDFIQWSSTRYNNYLCLGTKKQNVTTVYNSLVNGFYTDERGKEDQTKTVFTIECAGAVGETWNGKSNRYWKLSSKPQDYKYEVDCINKTITAMPSFRKIQFMGLAVNAKELKA